MLKKILALAALLLVTLAASASQLPDYPFIHMTGSAKLYVPPDMGAMDFEIIAADPDPAVARQTVETRVAEVRALVETLGLPAEGLEVRNVHQDLRKSQPGETQVYEIKCGVHLDVHDLSKWAGLANGLLGMKNLDGFATTFDTSEREKIEADLGAQAVRDARRKSEALATGFGRKLGPVAAVTTGSLKNLGNAMGLVRDESNYSRNRDRNVQRVEREALGDVVIIPMGVSVDVIFRLK